MKNKATKYADSPNMVNVKSYPSPVTRNKGRSVQVNSVRSQASSLSHRSSCERDKMQHIQEGSVRSKNSPVLSQGAHESNKIQTSQENSVTPKASSLPSQTVYDSNKIQSIQENPMGSKAVGSQSMCDSSMVLGESEQLAVITKSHKIIYPNGQNRYEEKNGNVGQNARGQNEVLTSVKCDTASSQVLQKPRGVERRNYVTIQNMTPKMSSVMSAKYAEQRESQNHCAEPKIADLRRGFGHQQTKNGSEIEYQTESKTMFLGFPEVTQQEQQLTTKIKESDSFVQVDSSRQIRDGSSNSDLRPTSAKEMEQASQLDLPPSKANGSVPIGTHIATFTGNSLTIKSGPKEVVLVFMTPSQSAIGRGAQTAEADHGNMFQECETPGTTRSLPAISTATNTIESRVLQSDNQEMPFQPTCDTTGNEGNSTNEHISFEKNSSLKIRDVTSDQVNDDSYRHSFRKIERPTPILLQAQRPLLCPAVAGPQTNMAVGVSGAELDQNTIPPDANPVVNKRELISVTESSSQSFSRTFDGSDVYIGCTENLIPAREVSAQTLPRNCFRNEGCPGSLVYHNSGLQMQLPSVMPPSAGREDARVNERTLLCDPAAAFQYGQAQLSSHEEPASEAHFQTPVPFMGQHSFYGRLPSYGQHTLRNHYRDEFMDMAPEPAYPVQREPIGVLRYRRFGPSYGGQYAYHLPLRNPERAHRSSFLDMRPHIYRRTVYPDQPYYGCVDSGNMFFLNRH